MLADFQEKLTIVFFGDRVPPRHLVVLRRGPNRKFAPNLYTGLGGKMEIDELPLSGAHRELKEEANLVDVDIAEFGRLIVNRQKLLCYFFGVWPFWPEQGLPSCTEGVLEWVQIEKLFVKDIIPTTRFFLDIWRQRNWDTLRPFTVLLERDDTNDINSPISSFETREGLSM